MSEFTDEVLVDFMSGAYMGDPATVREQWEKHVVPFLIDPKDKRLKTSSKRKWPTNK